MTFYVLLSLKEQHLNGEVCTNQLLSYQYLPHPLTFAMHLHHLVVKIQYATEKYHQCASYISIAQVIILLNARSQ